jgi:hypothetical protein
MASSEKFEADLRMILEAVDEAAHEGRAPLNTGAMRAELERLARMRGRPAFSLPLAPASDGARVRCSPTVDGFSTSR